MGERIPYAQQLRNYGSGSIRLGSYLLMSQNVYSLGFVSQINDELMDRYFNIVKG
jgi:hypothetical protein